MDKILELKRTIANLRKEVEALQAAENMDAAVAKATELREACNELKLAEAIKAANDAQNVGMAPFSSVGAAVDAAKLNVINNKIILGRPLTEEEQAIVNAAGTPGLVEATPGKGGYLVPEQQLNMLLELRRQRVALKDYCNVIPVASNSGNAPMDGEETAKLVAFDELNEIHKGDFDLFQVAFKVSSYGDIIPVSNELLQDNTFNLMGLIGNRFVKRAVNAENEKILALLGTPGTVITNWKDLAKALNVTLDPGVGAVAKIFTNQDGMQWLDEQEDTNKRPLLVPSIADPTKHMFRGHEVIVLSNALLPTKAKDVPFHVGSMFDAVAFFDRLGVEVAVDTSAGFTQNATLIRAIERFDVKKKDATAMTAVKVTLGA